MEPGDLLRRVYGILFGRPMNVSFIDDFVCGSALITSKKEMEWLVHNKGIKAILSMTEKPLPSDWTGMLTAYKNVQVANHKAPTMEQLDESVNFITENVTRKNKVLVHCAAGKGRTGTVLAAYLCVSQGISPQEAIQLIRSKRSGSVEKNSGQEESVVEFAKFLQNKKSG
ncbi:MAG: dual specificity protein phosphatase family protein [Thaumarchaeota archaeon]|nr:dual specificity protein phosphatase family protein [Nitrososphaerota archaeon]